MRLFIALLAAVLLLGCEDFFRQEITDFDDGFEPQLALFALLQPQDSLIVVDVRRTVAAIGGDSNDPNFRSVIADASVTISDGATTVALAYQRFPTEGYLAAVDTLPTDFLRPGGSYEIRATHEGLTAGGLATIPLDSLARSGVNFTIDQRANGGFTEVLAVPSLPNPPSEESYYVMITERSSAPSFDRRTRELTDFIRARANLGERLTLKPVTLREFNRTTVQLCVADAATYTFLSNRETAVSNGENPFAEPVLLSSNVTDGVGHLGGLNCQYFTFNR